MSESEKITVFVAGWCPVSVPLYRALGAEVVIVDVEKDFSSGEFFRIVSVPTVIFEVDGKERNRWTGVDCLGALEWVDRRSKSKRRR